MYKIVKTIELKERNKISAIVPKWKRPNISDENMIDGTICVF
jgi:hypothetical protein